MIFELLAVVAAGFAGAGVTLLANKLMGGRLPRWLIPTAAGAAMLAIAISNEYGWYPRTAQSLAEGFEIAATGEGRAFCRPWTYVLPFPFVTRFLAVDMASVRTNPGVAGQRIIGALVLDRRGPIGVQRRSPGSAKPGIRSAVGRCGAWADS